MIRLLFCKLGWHMGWREFNWHPTAIEEMCWICGTRRLTAIEPKPKSRCNWT